MSVKDEFLKRGSFVVGNGLSTRFWEDTWLGDKPLAEEYPSLYNIVHHKNVTVAHVCGVGQLNIGFRRTLSGNKWDRWIHLLQRLITIELNDTEDIFKWKLTASGVFTVKSMYLDLLDGHTIFLKKYIWKIKVPLKIRIFMWFVFKKVILTKDNLVKRNWHGCTKCCFCDQNETIDHLFISCPFARMIWRIVYMTFNIPLPSNITNFF
jgi:hypothetical protein